MNVARNEIRTGLIVLFSLTVMVGVLIYLGAPGVFTPQKQFGIYFDNAAGIKIGTPVMLAGRKVGQVILIASPVPTSERPHDKNGKALPLEARVMVRVDKKALIYEKCKVALANYSLLSEPVIDFTEGDESSGLAPENKHFVGDRAGGLVDAGVQILDKIDPLVDQLKGTLKSLQNTADNLTKITDEGGEFSAAIAEIHKVASNLKALTGPEGSFNKALTSIESLAGKDGEVAKAVVDFRKIIAPDGDLAKALANVEKFTTKLNDNGDVTAAIKNLRTASGKLDAAISEVRGNFSEISGNLEQASDTLKRQPWRLIWPSTKKYPEEAAAAPAKTNAKSKPTPTPKRR